MKKKVLAAIMAAAMVALTACGAAAPAPAPAAEPAATEEAAPAEAEAPAAEEEAAPAADAGALIKVGIINNDPNESGYRTANDKDLKAAFSEANGFDASFAYSLKNDEQITVSRMYSDELRRKLGLR